MPTSWPCSTGGAAGYYPAEDLFQIIEKAVSNAPVADAIDIVDKATDCALNHNANQGSNATDHCKYILSARQHASAMDWAQCKLALEHTGGMTPATALAPATPWPCDQGTAPTGTYDADQLLWEVIQLANQTAPVLEWQAVILAATECALTHEPESGMGYLNAMAHCKWLSKAKNYAQGANWSYCIGALEHIGGGVDPDEDAKPEATAEWEEFIGKMDRRIARRVRTSAQTMIELMKDIVRYEMARASGKWPWDDPHDPDA